MKNGITHINDGIDPRLFDTSLLKTADEIYIIPSYKCNLNCPHCTLKNIEKDGDIDKIIDTISYIKSINNDISFTLFGGEPSLLKDDVILRIIDAIGDCSYTVSTNLLKINDNFVNILKNAEWADTSWNPKRFHTPKLYDDWLNNLQLLKDNNVNIDIMITLTDDLIHQSPEYLIEKILFWDVKWILLEFMIGDDNLDLQLLDDWLLRLYKLWKSDRRLDSFVNTLFNRLENTALKKYKWGDYCNHTLTIVSNGNIRRRCPYYEYSENKFDCLTCSYYNYCQGGCPIQQKCNFPKKLFDYIRQTND